MRTEHPHYSMGHAGLSRLMDIDFLGRSCYNKATMRKPPKLSRKAKRVSREIIVPPKEARSITLGQVNYAYGRANGLSKREAAVVAGYADAPSTWKALEDSLTIKAFMRELAGKHGITPDLIMQKLGEGLNATIVRDFCTKGGDVVSSVPREDYMTRAQYLEIALRTFGLTPQKGEEEAKQGDTTNNIFILAEQYKSMGMEQVKELMQRKKLGVLTALTAGPDAVNPTTEAGAPQTVYVTAPRAAELPEAEGWSF